FIDCASGEKAQATSRWLHPRPGPAGPRRQPARSFSALVSGRPGRAGMMWVPGPLRAPPRVPSARLHHRHRHPAAPSGPDRSCLGRSGQRMKIDRIAPILTVDDLPTAIAEHTSVLGMHVVMHMDWVAFLADGTGRQIGLVTADATASVNPDVSVFVDDV